MRSSFAVGQYLEAFTHGDFNGDGLVDLAVVTATNSIRGSNQVVVLTNQGNFAFADAGHYPLDFRPDRILGADFNGDAHIDLTVLTQGGTLNGGSRLIALLGDGSGSFQLRPPVEVATTTALIEMGDYRFGSFSSLGGRGGGEAPAWPFQQSAGLREVPDATLRL